MRVEPVGPRSSWTRWSQLTPAGRRGVTLPAGTGERWQVPPLPAQDLLLKAAVWTWHLVLPPSTGRKATGGWKTKVLTLTYVCHQLAFLGFGLLTFHMSMKPDILL